MLTTELIEQLFEAAHIQRDFGNSVGHSADEPLGSTTAGGVASPPLSPATC